MTWQEPVFLVGSVLSLLVLVPTLRNSMANVPLGTGLPSAALGIAYGLAFLSLDAVLSATGALLTGGTWSLIAGLRSPSPPVRENVGGTIDRISLPRSD